MSSHLEGGGPPLPTAWPTFPPAVPRGTACLPCQALLGPSWPRTRSPVGWRGPCHAFFSHSVPQAWGVQGRAVQAGDRGQGIPQRAMTGGCPQRGDCGLPGLLLPGSEGPAGRPGRAGGVLGPTPTSLLWTQTGSEPRSCSPGEASAQEAGAAFPREPWRLPLAQAGPPPPRGERCCRPLPQATAFLQLPQGPPLFRLTEKKYYI